MNQLTNATTATIASVPTVILALNIEELKGVVGFAIMIVAFFYWTFAMIAKGREAFFNSNSNCNNSKGAINSDENSQSKKEK
ncbi:MAG: hypothetical protein LUD72_09785 [Bacteroidales bacterium]|nr:hypothetical protein [Bacteroidales bacterium]